MNGRDKHFQSKLKIAVLFGGASSERDVSIASAAQVVKALRSLGHEVSAVDTATGVLTGDQEEKLFSAGVAATAPHSHGGLGQLAQDPAAFFSHPAFDGIDLVFIALHGGAGEDGRLQALLDLKNIPYTASGVIGSACAMDKDIAKRLMRQCGVPTPDWLMAPVDAATVDLTLGWPVVVKASKQGSTVGLSVVRNAAELPAAIELAFQHDDEVLVEQFIPGRELTVGILDGKPLGVGEIVLTRGEIFDYEAKYQPGGAIEVFPAEIDEAETAQIQLLGSTVAQALKLRDYCRVDFRRDAQGGLWCLEANTLPGMTAMSLLPQSAAVSGLSFPQLCQKICDIALRRSDKH
jgi:D-alanine-D-alanine ligase